MLYILDAYNVIHKLPYLEEKLDTDLRSAREALAQLCSQWACSRKDIEKIILVFDGRSEFQDIPQLHPPKIKSVYSETGEDADEKIIELLESLLKTKNKCVVSDDNFVRNHARIYETTVVTVSEFDRLIHPHTSAAPEKIQNSKKFMDPKLADEITRDYRKKLGLD